MDELRKEHDDLLEKAALDLSEEDFSDLIEKHKPQCPYCKEEADTADDSLERGDMDKEFTQEDVDAAVNAAVAPIQAELDALKAQVTEGQVDAQVAAVKAEAEQTVASIQTQLDEAVNAKGAAEAELERVVAWLASEAEAKELSEWAEALKSARKSALVENSNLTEEYIDANIDRWVAMDEDTFEAVVDGFKASKVETPEGEGKAESAKLETAMKNNRVENAGASTKEDIKNLLKAHTAGYNVNKI